MRKLFFAAAGLMLAILSAGHAFAGESPKREVSIARHGHAVTTVVIKTIAVAVKETETKQQLSTFGEVYAFSPSFFAVHRDEPTRIDLWNLQPDDKHDFTLIDPSHKVLKSTMLAPLTKTSMVVIFHRAGLYTFICSIHQPGMSGQILVLPPR